MRFIQNFTKISILNFSPTENLFVLAPASPPPSPPFIKADAIRSNRRLSYNMAIPGKDSTNSAFGRSRSYRLAVQQSKSFRSTVEQSPNPPPPVPPQTGIPLRGASARRLDMGTNRDSSRRLEEGSSADLSEYFGKQNYENKFTDTPISTTDRPSGDLSEYYGTDSNRRSADLSEYESAWRDFGKQHENNRGGFDRSQSYKIAVQRQQSPVPAPSRSKSLPPSRSRSGSPVRDEVDGVDGVIRYNSAFVIPDSQHGVLRYNPVVYRRAASMRPRRRMTPMDFQYDRSEDSD